MINTIIISLLLLLTFNALGQKTGPTVILKKDTTVQNMSVYDMSITNRSDSVLCILRSLFISLTADSPQVLGLDDENPEFDDFSLKYSAIDTGYTFEVAPYIGELILPGQKLSFKIRLLLSGRKKPRHLSFEYFYLNELDYRKFMLEMRKVGSWYNKYTRHGKSVDLPF